MSTRVLELLITYIPLGIFVLAVFFAFILGLIRGFRKSLILFIHALLAATICIIVFYVLVNNPNTDKWAYQLSSQWINYNDKLQTTTEYSSMKEVIVDYFLQQNSYGDGMRLILEENGAYLDTLVNLAYRLILFLPLLVVFFVLDFLFYIVYFIFYPERRKKARLRKREREGNGLGYKKHPWFGGLVGVVRGTVVGLVWLSFIGALFFIVAGGTGEDDKNSYPDYSFADDTLNTAYDSYKIVSTYGNSGLFRVLNTLKDSENVPYYLFAANMILSGNLNDSANNVHTTVRFTKELSCYTSFVNKTIKLVLKYDTNGEISKAMSNNDTDSLTNFLNELMEKEEFKTEYDKLIEEFDSGTYFINFALSFVNSVVAHRKQLKLSDNLDPQIVELMDIIFDGDHKIMVSDILTEGDAKHLMKSVVKVLSAQTMIDENTDTTKKVMIYAKTFIPEVLELSMFKDESRKAKFNPLLGDLYEYLANNVVIPTQSSNQNLAVSKFDLADVLETTNVNADSISWVDELKTLLVTSMDLIEIADSVYVDSDSILNTIFNIFPEDNKELKDKNLERFDRLINGLSNSKLLDAVLSMSVIRDAIDNGLAAMSENIKLPSKINYVNVYDSQGNIETYGEINVLLTALKELILNNKTKELVTALENKTYNQEIIKSLSELFTNKLSDGTSSLIDISLRSTVLKYIISGVFLGFDDMGDMGFEIVIPSNLCVKDKEGIVTISDDELKNLFTSLVGTLDIFGDNNQIDFKKVVDNVTNLSSSQIIEASVVNVLVTTLESVDAVSIPEMYKEAAKLENLKGDYSTNIWHTKAEISNIIYAIDEIFNVSLVDTFDLESSMNEISSKFANLTAEANLDSSKMKLDIVYESAILRSTVKEFVTKQITADFIDQDLLNSSAVVANIDGVPSIKKEEVKSVIYSVNELALDLANIDFSNLASLITSINGPAETEGYAKKIDVLYSSAILRYAIAKQLDKALADNTALIDTAIIESNNVKTTETFDTKDYKHYSKAEIQALIDSIGVFGITDVENINTDSIKTKILNVTDADLDTLYGSYIIKYAVAKQLDSAVSSLVAEDIKDSTLVKEYLTIDDVQYGYFKKDELKAMINSLKILNIDDVNNVNADNVKSSILDLNDEKITTMYGSYIIKYVLAGQLDSAIGGLVNEKIKNSTLVKKFEEIKSNYYGYYLKEEILAMIDSLKVLAIDDINNFNADKVKATILEFNDAKITTLYGSYIIKFAIANQLDTAIENVVNEKVRNSNYVKDYVLIDEDNYGYYDQDELLAMVNSLNVLSITDINNFTVSDIKNQVATFNDPVSSTSANSKLDILYTSYVIKYALSERFDQVFTDATLNVNEVVLDENKLNDEISSQYYYKKESVIKLIDAFGVNALNVSTLDDADDINENTILTLNEKATGASKTRLDIIYESDIMAYILSDKLQAAINSNSYLIDDIDAKYLYKTGSTVYLYKTNELKTLIKVLNDLHISDVNNFSGSSITLSNAIKEDINGSILLFDTVSNLVFNNDSLVCPSVSKIKNSDNTVSKIVSETQMNYLLDTLISLGVTGLSGNISLTLNETIIENISKSYILRATVSDKIISNANILVSTSVIDTTVITDVPAITEAELENTLNAILVGLGISDVSTISATISLPGKDDTTKDARLTAISKSQIIRTTITDKIEFKNGTETINLQLFESDTDLLVKYGTTDKLLSLKEEEMVKLLNGIITTFGGSGSTSTSSSINYSTLLAMSDDDFATFIESSTIRIITANLLGTTYVYGAYELQCGVKSKTPKSEKELDISVYSTTTKTTSNIDFYNDVTQKDIVSTLRGVALP